MIARHETTADQADIWAQLSAPLPAGVIEWRQDGRAMQRGDKFFARFVAYVSANTVRERLDQVVPGEWDLHLELLPTVGLDADDEPTCSFKARLQILGVIREDVGSGKDYKQAATDAFKRAAVRFGIAHELYSYEQNWVQVDGDGKYAKPLEDPADAYARKMSRSGSAQPAADRNDAPVRRETPASEQPASDSNPEPAAATHASNEPSCPKCGGKMWDNRISKRNPKAPDFKCRSRSCDGVIWPPKPGDAPAPASAARSSAAPTGIDERAPLDDRDDLEELPF